jgi:DNA-binding response OmpR family regulator
VIFIASNSKREAAAVAGLCESHSWPCQVCSSIVGFGKLLGKTLPRAVVTRHQLSDGYSDEILALLNDPVNPTGAKVLVLAPAGFSSKEEGRQIALGAACVLRDPVRMDVLVEYLAKYRTRVTASLDRQMGSRPKFDFAGATVFPQERRIEYAGRSVRITPKEIEFIQILARAPGKVVAYGTLYSEILERAFAGDTTNMRVLFAKVGTSFSRIGIEIRTVVHVIPKTGYHYLPPLSDQQSTSRQR